MTSIKVQGTLLTASVDDRTLTYRLLPFGEQGRTSLGKVTAARGTVTIPDDVPALVGNIEHDPTRPVARFARVEETDEGLDATLRVLPTTAGNDLLVEAAEGVRPGISVELDGVRIRDGRLLAGTLTGAGFVTRPAFPSALLVAADAGEDPTDPAAEADHQADEATDKEEAIVAEQIETTEEVEVMTASAPLGMRPSAKGKPATTGEVFKMLAAAYKSGGQSRLLAALSDIVPGDILGQEQPQYVGELWSGKAFVRRIIPLLNHADLTSFKVAGWRWDVKPAVAPYLGDKTAVPSNQPTTVAVSIDAERIAGGHDIDRKFRDFSDEEFWASYWRAMTESYAMVSDGAVLADIITAAGAATPMGTVPAGVAPGMVAIVDGALEVLTNTNSLPTFAVVPTALWRGIVLTKEDDVLAYLNASMGLENGTIDQFRIIPTANPALPADQVLVGARDAATVHELGGEAPIRVEALNVPNGGIDAAVFGYYAVNVHDADGLALVDTTP